MNSTEEIDFVSESFNAEAYKRATETMFPDGIKFFLENIHSVLANGKFPGSKCIEVGCGPTVFSLASASKYYNHIITGDYLNVNNTFVESWLRKDANCGDFSKFLKFVADLEGYSNLENGQKEIEARLRSTIKAVVQCDFNRKGIVPESAMEEYDLLITSLALGCACKDKPAYLKALKNTAKLLRKGGGLLMLATTGATFWSVKGQRYHTLPFTDAEMTQYLSAAGFGNIEVKSLVRREDSFDADFATFVFVMAEKV